MKPKITRQNYGVGSFINYRWRVENHPAGVKSFSRWKQAIRYALMPWQSTSYPLLLDSPSISFRFRQLPTDDEPLADYTMDHEGHMTPLSERAQNWREADNADAGYC